MPNIYWLSGNLAQKKLALNELKSQFADAESQTFHGDGTLAFLEREIYTSSCLGAKRLIIIECLPSFDGTKQTMINRLKKLLSNAPDDIAIIFNGIDVSKEEALSNHVATIGKVYDFPSSLTKQNANQWVTSQFFSYGKTISEEDADILVQMSGYDKTVKCYVGGGGGIGIDVLTLAIKKICAYVGNRRKNITKDDLINTAFESEEYDTWGLFNAFETKDLDQCYRAIERIKVEHDEDHLKDALETIFSKSLWRYKMLFCMKMCKQSPPEAKQYFGSIQKLSQTGAGFKMKMVREINKEDGSPKMMYNAGQVQSAFDGQWGRPPLISKYKPKELRCILEVLQEGMKCIRGADTDAALLLLLDTLVLAICGKADDNILRSMRISSS